MLRLVILVGFLFSKLAWNSYELWVTYSILRLLFPKFSRPVPSMVKCWIF